MLSNRRWWLKVLIPILGFGGVSAHAAWSLPKTRVGIRDCLAKPDEFDGRTVWLDAREVKGHDDTGVFTTVGDGLTVRVKGDYVPSDGKHVSVRGTFRKPDLVVADSKILKYDWYKAQRGGAYTISGAVLLAWLWWFLKRFRPGLRGFVPREDAPPDAPPPGAEKT